MHSVLQNLYNRRDKKVPVNDGRKIVLVLFGGTMNGVRSAGIMIALKELGLTHAFDQIYALSAGVPNACGLLSEQTQMSASILYEDLIGKEFMNLTRLWMVIDTGFAVDVFEKKKRLDVVKLKQARTDLMIGLYNLTQRECQYKRMQDFSESEMFSVIRAATSIPYLTPGSINLRGEQYMDFPFRNYLYNLHIQTALESKATDVLIIFNYHDQVTLTMKLSQHALLIQPQPQWDLSRFEQDPEKLKSACIQMGTYFKSMFGVDEPIKL